VFVKNGTQSSLLSSQVALQLWFSEVGFHGILEALGIILNEIRKLENLGFAIGNRFELSALEARLQSGTNLPFPS
jgi:hypothetical protein